MTAPVAIGTVIPQRVMDRLAVTTPANMDPAEAATETAAEAAERRQAARALADARRSAARERMERRVPRRFRGARLADLTAEQDPNGRISGWWDSEAITLILHAAESGLGKTHAAYATAYHALAAGATVEAWTVIEMLAELRPSGEDGLMARLVGCDALVLDDLGKEAPSPWGTEQIFRIVSSRVANGLRTVVTTNLTGEGLTSRYDSALVDRLVDAAVVERMRGTSRRRPLW